MTYNCSLLLQRYLYCLFCLEILPWRSSFFTREPSISFFSAALFRSAETT
jgi:hypothetical protein